jgi:hypothetical protein
MKSVINQNKIYFDGAYREMKKYLRLFLYLLIFAIVGMSFTSCVGGYVATEPVYSGYDRPASPGVGYIWIDGDWNWNRQSRSYEHEHGYWTKSKEGRAYQSGHWESGPRGKSWVRGRWNKQNEKANKADHDRDHIHDRDHN